MSEKNDACMGQLSLFCGFLTECCDTKPEIGTKLLFYYENNVYECVVAKHCGFDFFWVEFCERQPADDFLDVAVTGGWHVSLRGFKKDWDFWRSNI